MFDVLICGAGVAGCALAIHLRRRGLRVLLIGRKQTQTRRVGEHLPPHARPFLEALGVWPAVADGGHLRCPGVQSAWGSPHLAQRDFVYTPYGDGWNLDRARFDACLLDAARAAGSAIRFDAALSALHKTAQGWNVTITAARDQTMHRCRVLVDASGRASVLARKLGSHRIVYDRLVGVASWLVAPTPPGVRGHTLLVEAAAQGWWYTTPLPNRMMVAVWMTDPPLAQDRGMNVQSLWRSQLAQTVHARQRLAGYQVAGETVVRPANTYRMDPLAGDGWLAAGDAAAALDPLTSMGIYRALTSAQRAADAINRYLDGETTALAGYAAAVRRDFEDQRIGLIWTYRQERRWLEHPFWRVRHLGQPLDAWKSIPPTVTAEVSYSSAGHEA